jgi:hypothetical protein
MEPVQPEVMLAILQAAGVLCVGLLVAFAVERLLVQRLSRPAESAAGMTHRCRGCRRGIRSFVAAVANGDDVRAEQAAARVLGRNDLLTPHDGR